jgi:Raf kinase inhibitor-like YbhB/YbcL family protein
MHLTSSAFHDNGLIPSKYAHHGVTGGANVSVPLAWGGVPPGTASLALSMIDPHPVARDWVHWLVVNIPPSVTSVAEGASGSRMPAGAMELTSTYGETGYGGPEPPKGSGPHPYVTTLYALDVARLECTLHTSRAAFLTLVDGHVLARAVLTGIYER